MTWFKLYCRCVHVTKSWHCPCNSSISMRSYHNLNFIKDLTRKYAFFWKVALVQVQQLGTDTRYKLEILHQCGKRVKTKSQKVLGANSYICRSYRGKTGRGPFCLSRVNIRIFFSVLNSLLKNSRKAAQEKQKSFKFWEGLWQNRQVN